MAMPILYSDRTRQWSGFEPLPYTLSAKKIWKLPLAESEKISSEPTTTVGEAYRYFAEGERPVVKRELLGISVTRDGETRHYSNPSFSCDLLAILLSLRSRDVDPFGVVWFSYDSDHVTDDTHASYAFFVVSGEAMIEESVKFPDYSSSAFEPGVFDPPDSEPTWRNGYYWPEAYARYWYRRFYTESLTGKLLVLRPDEPPLYYYPEGRWSAAVAHSRVASQLTATQRLSRWSLIAEIAIVALLVWKWLL